MKTTRSPAALAPWVASIWHFEGAELSHPKERVLPSARAQILVNLAEDRLCWWDGADLQNAHYRRGAALSGPFDQAIAVTTAEQRAITGVTFEPGGAQAFFNIPAGELGNDQVELGDLGAGSLREGLLEAGDPASVLATWERWLRERLRPHRDRRVAFARESLEAGRAVAWVASQLGVSSKRLRQLFVTQIGMTPKRYARVQRLQRLVSSLALTRAGPAALPWTQLARNFGFYDQAHLIHELRELAGTTPTSYRPRDPEDWNHVALP